MTTGDSARGEAGSFYFKSNTLYIMTKVYVIGAKDSDMKRIREITETSEDNEIILIDDMSQIPMADRRGDVGVKEIFPITMTPRCEQTFFPELRKGHERPYKFHK